MTVTRSHITRSLIVAALAMAISACGRQAPLAPMVSHSTSYSATGARPAPIAVDQAIHFEGQTGPGSTYTIDIPAGWNHDLVVYAHGIILPREAPIGPPDFNGLRDLLLAQGFAVTASTFDENGYALKDGLQRTHQLTELFTTRFGTPGRVYLIGKSLGGIIALDLIESYPDQYAGALTVSGVLGGTARELDYVASVRVLFDALYPGVLPGTLYQVPPIDPNQIVTAIVAAIQSNPSGAGVIAAMMGGRLQYASSQELVSSIVNTLLFQLLGANDLFDRTHDHSFFDNADVQYTGPVPPLTPEVIAAVNAAVARYSATPDAVNYTLHYYEPTGNLVIPLLALHNQRDPQVPYFNEIRYHDLVVATGHSDNLVQLLGSQPYGHAQFSDQEVAGRFQQLVTWVGGGAKPTQ
jgi:pimeloyl-ACP methyl ester carboxylesterase